MSSNTVNNNSPQKETTRRDFIVVAASASAAMGGAAAMWPFIDSLNPAADTLALSTTEVNISTIQPGQSIKTMWQGKTVFIRRRTPEEVEKARSVEVAELPDPQNDAERVKEGRDEWLVVVGICTHLGCIPLNYKGEYDGWFCPCHGSHYDTSGRIRKGPAPTNLLVPPYSFIDDGKILIG